METQTWLSCHYKIISVENITIHSVSSDDFLHAFLEVAEQQMGSYSSYFFKIYNYYQICWVLSMGQIELLYSLYVLVFSDRKAFLPRIESRLIEL